MVSKNGMPSTPRATHCYPHSLLDGIVAYERYFKAHPEINGPWIDLPFTCDHCNEQRFQLEMIGGDGDLICSPCFESYVKALGG